MTDVIFQPSKGMREFTIPEEGHIAVGSVAVLAHLVRGKVPHPDAN